MVCYDYSNIIYITIFNVPHELLLPRCKHVDDQLYLYPTQSTFFYSVLLWLMCLHILAHSYVQRPGYVIMWIMTFPKVETVLRFVCWQSRYLCASPHTATTSTSSRRRRLGCALCWTRSSCTHCAHAITPTRDPTRSWRSSWWRWQASALELSACGSRTNAARTRRGPCSWNNSSSSSTATKP